MLLPRGRSGNSDDLVPSQEVRAGSRRPEDCEHLGFDTSRTPLLSSGREKRGEGGRDTQSRRGPRAPREPLRPDLGLWRGHCGGRRGNRHPRVPSPHPGPLEPSTAGTQPGARGRAAQVTGLAELRFPGTGRGRGEWALDLLGRRSVAAPSSQVVRTVSGHGA